MVLPIDREGRPVTAGSPDRPSWWRKRWQGLVVRCSALALCVAAVSTGGAWDLPPAAATPPHVVFVFADQWRADACGFAGDPNVKTPHLDRLASRSIRFTQAVSSCPVCSPYRASLLTGRRPLSHGVFVNDVPLAAHEVSIAEVFAAQGYTTAYIGKWHVDGHGRSAYIPPERRQGFEYFQVLECTHDYNHSPYYAGDDPTRRIWEGYDALAQTEDAIRYLRQAAAGPQPFLLMLSWGPPHNPYDTAPESFRAMYRAEAIQVRPNVPPAHAAQARQDLAGYYAHCSALDACLGRLWQTLCDLQIEDETLLVFTSDHGDLLYSHGQVRKQQPWDEAIRVPLVVHYPRLFGDKGKSLDAVISTEDLLPTLAGLAGLPVPPSVDGLDFSRYMQGAADPSDGAALLTCVTPFGEWRRDRGGREYRGLRTRQYTYVRSLDGPWLLFDNQADPYQLTNLMDRPASRGTRAELDALLQRKLAASGDQFLPGAAYLERWGYQVDAATGTVPYTN